MRGLRSHLTYANVVATLALVIAVGGGAAYAANTVFSSDIVNNAVRGVDVRDDSLEGGGLGHVDIKAGAVRTSEVGVNSLTGGDIADQSGVDTCTHGTTRFGELCVRVANLALIWTHAVRFCGDLELRLPTLGDAMSLASNHDIPGVDSGEEIFWTDEFYVSDQYIALAVEAGGDVWVRRADRLHYSGDRLRDDADQLTLAGPRPLHSRA